MKKLWLAFSIFVSSMVSMCGGADAQSVQMMSACGVVPAAWSVNGFYPFTMAPGGLLCTQPMTSGDIIATPSQSFTRPANTTAYSAGQTVANSTTAGSVTPLIFTGSARIAAGNFYVRRAQMWSSGKTTTSASFVLHLYRASPTISAGDGATWSTTLTDLICDLPISLTDSGTDFATGWGTPSNGTECNFQLSAGTSIYGLLTAAAAYTPTSGETEKIQLELHQN